MAGAKKKALVLVDYNPLKLKCGHMAELTDEQLKELEAQGIVDPKAPAPKKTDKGESEE
jgi:hypothetical protein